MQTHSVNDVQRMQEVYRAEYGSHHYSQHRVMVVEMLDELLALRIQVAELRA